MSDLFYTKLRSMVGLQGLLSLVFGLLIVFWPNRTAAAVTIMVGIAFIAIGAAYVAAIVLLFSPLIGAAILWLLLGLAMIIVGVVKIFQYFTWSHRYA